MPSSGTVPRNTPRNQGLITVTLMRCMARMPCAEGMDANARITNVEKVKNTPPTRAEATDEAIPSTVGASKAVLSLFPDATFRRNDAGHFKENSWIPASAFSAHVHRVFHCVMPDSQLSGVLARR